MGSSEEEAVSAANSFPRDSSDPVTPSSMRFEGQRLRTFSDWPADAPVEARKVARAGFFRPPPDRRGDEATTVQCFWCGLVISDWDYGDQVMTRHREASPECPFVKNDSGNVPLQSVNSEDSSSQQEEAEAQQERPPAIPSSPGDSRARDGTGGPEEAMDESVAREAAPDAAASSSSFPEGRVLLDSPDEVPDRRRRSSHLDDAEAHDVPPEAFANVASVSTVSAVSSGRRRGLAGPGDTRRESVRLKTFAKWPKPFIPPTRLAKSGFIYTGSKDCVRCVFCGEFVGEWTPSDDPLVEHQTLFPHCPFVQGQPVGNVPLGEDEETSLDLQGPSYSWSSGSYSDSTGEQQRTARGVDETGMRERRRYLNSGPERGPGVLRWMGSVSSGRDSESSGILRHSGPAHPKHSTLENRLRTFRDWPPALKQQPQELAEAGFFYIGRSDQVKCFYCDGGLRNWQPDDDPWTEHSRWFSRCGFVRLVKGDEFIAECMAKKPPENGMMSLDETTTLPPAIPAAEVSESSLRAAMASPLVQQVLSLGVDASRVKMALRQRMVEENATNSPSSLFSTAAELMDAAFGVHRDQENRATAENSESPAVFSTTPTSQEAQDVAPLSFPMSAQLSRSSSDPNNSRIKEEEDVDEVEKTASKSQEVTPARESAGVEVQAADLEQENRRLKEQRTCKICMDREIGVVFLPCGHLICCIQCAPALKDCPLCRQPIHGTVKTYMS